MTTDAAHQTTDGTAGASEAATSSGTAGAGEPVPVGASGTLGASEAATWSGVVGGDEGPEVVGALSPSRAGDFMTCPLLYRFRVIDKIPEQPTPAMLRGTVVHAVLERLFELPATERTPERAGGLLEPEWARILEEDPELAAIFHDDAERAGWLNGARELIGRYFTLEDPTRLEPAEREMYVETVLDSGLKLRGYIDRLDVAPGGAVRIVDYKTGTAPSEVFEARALFQMKFYALVLWRLRGEVPRLLQLMYLGSGEVLRYEPGEAELVATERKLRALWTAIQRAKDTGDWRARRSRLCDWCDHQSRCPEFGGTPPPLPDPDATADATDPEPAHASGADL